MNDDSGGLSASHFEDGYATYGDTRSALQQALLGAGVSQDEINQGFADNGISASQTADDGDLPGANSES